MQKARRNAKCLLRVESMEERLLLSSAAHHPVGTPPSHKTTFVARLTPSNVVLPLDFNGDQIQGGGGAGLFPTPPSTDPARGTIVFTHTGKEIKVTGSLSHISNVSAITIRDLNYPALFPLRGSTTSPATQPPALQPNTPALVASTQSIPGTPTPSPTPPPGDTEVDTTTKQYATTSATVPSPITTTTTQKAITPQGGGPTTTITTVSAAVTSTSDASNTPTNAPSPGPIYYAANTVNSAAPATGQTSQNGQVFSSNTGQTVELVLNPGNGSGPLPSRAQFNTVIKAQYMQGPLARAGGFHQFLQDMRDGKLYVLVQTNNGYDQATGPQQDSNFPNGELRGRVT